MVNIRLTAGIIGARILGFRVKRTISSMSTWEVEKNIHLNMSVEEKRKLYKGKSYVTLDKVPTWTDMASNAPPPLDRDRNIFGSTKLNTELNKILADKISIWRGDITQLEIGAIVNAANKELKGGGGVDGAIHRAAGPNLLDECKSIKGCPTGQARITGGYLLPASYVIHTVGPTDKSPTSLTNCYKSCFILQETNSIKSIAFPCIGTGIYGFPNVDAAHIACRETRNFLENIFSKDDYVDRVIFCIFESKDWDIYSSVAQLYFPLQ